MINIETGSNAFVCVAGESMTSKKDALVPVFAASKKSHPVIFRKRSQCNAISAHLYLVCRVGFDSAIRNCTRGARLCNTIERVEPIASAQQLIGVERLRANTASSQLTAPRFGSKCRLSRRDRCRDQAPEQACGPARRPARRPAPRCS